jgi:putative lipoic acid-binding regulatory protein
MMVLNKLDRKVQIEYPCSWLYKVIGEDLQEVRQAIVSIIEERRCIITHSNSSKSGKYHCLNVELIVQTEEVRNGLYQTLKNHPAIRIVL